jgi:type I restriction enzyme S subunit
MADKWPRLSLREANVTLIDCDHRTPPASEDGYPYVAIPQLRNGRIDLSGVRRITHEHFVDWTRKAKPSANDVVLSRRTNPGETAFVPPGLEFALGQNLVLLRADGTRVHPPFLRWLVRGPDWWEQIRKFLNVGAVFDSLKCADIPRFQLCVPPLPEQRAIAHILGTLDGKIELNRRMNQTLESIARALFKSWFVDFDPVRAKAGGRDPGLATPFADLFPDSFEDSKLGVIPRGWAVQRLSDTAELMIGGDWGRDEARPDDVPVRCLRGVDLDNLRQTGWSDAPRRFVSKDSLQKRRPAATDVIVEGSGECGRSVAFWPSLAGVYEEPVIYSNFCKRIRCESAWMAHYVEYLLNELVSSGEMKNFVTGTAMPNLDHKGLLSGLSFVVPSDGSLEAFGRFAASARARLFSPTPRTLAALRDTLLPKLLSGEVRVSDVERMSREAV